MATTQSSTLASAPYGQACEYCSKAKTRCIPRATGNKCERLVIVSSRIHTPALLEHISFMYYIYMFATYYTKGGHDGNGKP